MDRLGRVRDSVVIGVVGDRRTGSVPQDTIESALAHSAHALGTSARVEWFDTPTLTDRVAEHLRHVDGVWCTPGGPFRSMEGALEAIRFARESSRPFLGTCAGFQLGVVEFARNALGITNAHHAEYETTSGQQPLLVDELLCSLAGQTMTVQLVDPSLRELYGSAEAREQYYCRFGLNESYLPALAAAGLTVAAVDRRDGTTRIMRIAGHPFFFLTLFVPQASSTHERPHPVVTGYLAAVLDRRASSAGGREW